MREIKFRGFVEAESKWIYGDLLHSYWHLDGVVYETAIRYKINDGYSYPIPVKPDTVGQFTGLYDKDGREIYENCMETHPRTPRTFKRAKMTELQLHKFVTENSIEWRWDTNNGNEDVVIFLYPFNFSDFFTLISGHALDEGFEARLMDGYAAIWMDDICECFGIKIENVFSKSEQQ
jgi:hypothetical protein